MASTDMQHTNRLIRSSSPYLLQHAHNPVDWYEWGEEAFLAAREQDKLIFLSVGYSTCYWCHVMERECFENEDIAQLMNEHFINIKVDREERPDVDDIYMTAVQLITRQGGWPMSMWLEPKSLKPVVGGTYFPPEDSYGRPGFPSVLNQLAEAWRERRGQVVKQAEQIATAVTEVLSQQPPIVPLGHEQVEQAVAMLMRQYDRNHGGFGSAPKFPTPVNLDLLMDVAWERDDVREAATHTLNRMATGGMYDQIGGGFHRYSVDEKWLVPHFEKMLYDNGQLALTYTKAFELTGDAFYERVLRRTLEYVLREMTDDSSGGGFYSAQDAEVDAREGLNYLWTADEVRDVLKRAGLHEDVDFTLEVYGFNRGTNFLDPHHPHDEPKNVVYLIDHPDTLASLLQISEQEFFTRLDRINEVLLAARSRRTQPRLDDKTITGWNGLMIAGFAEAARVLNEPRYLEAAKRAAAFVRQSLRTEDGGLCRTARNGKPGPHAVLEDYAFFAHGLLALHRATDEREYLDHAIELIEAARERFQDEQAGGLFDTLEDQHDLFVRTKGHYDGATPCGNSVMMLNLIEVTDRTGDERYLDEAARSLRAFSGFISQQPTGLTVSVRALHEMLLRTPELVAGGETQADASAERSPVAVSIEPGDLQFDESGTAGLEVTLSIQDGYHINAHEPGIDELVPLTIDLDGNVDATPHYPRGERLNGAAFADEPVSVHTGQVRVPVTIERTGDMPERLRLMVTYQACTDEACLSPRTEVAQVRVQERE
jgi:uncharacterized protein